MEKKQITIEVEPILAVVTIGLIRGIFPSIIRHIETDSVIKGFPLKFPEIDEMKEVLDEIYEKCIAETDIRKSVWKFLNDDDLPN